LIAKPHNLLKSRRWRALIGLALSVLVLVSCAGLWLRSHCVADSVGLAMPGYVRLNVMSTAGVVEFQYFDGEAPQLVPDVERWTISWYRYRPGPRFGAPTRLQKLGFDYFVSEPPSLKGVRIIAPWWAITTLLTLPVAWQTGAAVRRRRRLRRGLCPR
jgi:hypothetical protein